MRPVQFPWTCKSQVRVCLIPEISSRAHAPAVNRRYLNARFSAGLNANVKFRRLAVVGQRSSNNGGFLSCFGCKLHLQNVYIADNVAAGFGGAIQADTASNIVVMHSIFVNNECQNFGGAIDSWGDVQAVNSTFMYNRAQMGGAISCCRGNRGGGGNHSFSQSSFVHNSAVEQAGGGLFISKGTLVLRSSKVLRNQATEAGGGGVCADQGVLYVYDSTFQDNFAHAKGDTFSIERTNKWLIANSRVSPSDEKSALQLKASTSFTCQTNPCEPGMQCRIKDLSRTCTLCKPGTASLRGE